MIVSDWHRFPGGWACQLTWRGGSLHCEWNRSKPPRPSQRAKLAAAYDAVLVAFLNEVQSRIGVPVVLVR